MSLYASASNRTHGTARDAPLLLKLLAYAATDLTPSGANLLEEVDDLQFRWVMDAGLGPLLYRAVASHTGQTSSTRRSALLSADLTAQVKHGNLVDTAIEIVDLCNGLRVPVTLLKGISFSDQYYPSGHLRPMGDIDILVPEQAHRAVEAALLDSGYIRMAGYQADEHSHHGIPLRHPQRDAWVEVHRMLFSKNVNLRCNALFSASNIAAQSVVSTFHGRPVHRLTRELQLVYLASTWIRDLSRNPFHPTLAIPLVDSVRLLCAAPEALDWNELLTWLDNDMARASLYLMLGYLSRHGLYRPPQEVISQLESTQDLVRGVERTIIHALVHNYLVSGKPFTRLFRAWHVWDTLLAPGSHVGKLVLLPWNIVFPRSAPDRYRPSYHVRRIGRRLRGED